MGPAGAGAGDALSSRRVGSWGPSGSQAGAPRARAPPSSPDLPRPLRGPGLSEQGKDFSTQFILPPGLPASGKTSLLTAIPKPETRGSSWHHTPLPPIPDPSPSPVNFAIQNEQLSSTPSALHPDCLRHPLGFPAQPTPTLLRAAACNSKSKSDDAETHPPRAPPWPTRPCRAWSPQGTPLLTRLPKLPADSPPICQIASCLGVSEHSLDYHPPLFLFIIPPSFSFSFF